MTIDEYYQKAFPYGWNGKPFVPNPLQCAVWNKFSETDHPALLIRAGTGSGKTEAILLPALFHNRRILLIMPSKALIEDMAERVKGLCKNLSCTTDCQLTITVDMGGSCRRFCCKNGQISENEYIRHLFVDDIIITTLDKFLFRIFGYGEQIKSYIFPHRIFGETLGKKPFIIFDEAHEYEGVAFTNFCKLIEALYVKGKDFCVMSATFPVGIADFLNTIDALEGSLAAEQNEFQKNVLGMVRSDKHVVLIRDTKNIIETIAEEIEKRFDQKKRIIVRVELVEDVIALYLRLKEKGMAPYVYHGRLPAKQRRKVITELIALQTRNEGFLVLTTSAIEAGCDFDAHLIITELCPPDSLVQLAGRLNRRGQMNDAQLVIVGNKLKTFENDYHRPLNVEDYLKVLESMNGIFQPSKLQHFFTNPPKSDWMSEILFDMLWDYVYEGDLTCRPLWDRGILVTRSWEPSITLCTGLMQDGIPKNPIQVGISRIAKKISYNDDKDKRAEELLSKKASELFSITPDGKWHAEIYRTFYDNNNNEEGQWKIYPFPQYRISAYETDLICVIEKEFVDKYYDEQLGYKRIPKILLYGSKNGFERIFNRPVIKNDHFKLNANKYPETEKGSVWFLEP